jgi:hypothetical protein
MNEEREEKARKNEHDAELLCKELRYTQQTVASELAGWRDMHERLGRKAIRDLARGMVTMEKMRLEGIKRALRRVKEVGVDRTVRWNGGFLASTKLGGGEVDEDDLFGSEDVIGAERPPVR